MKKSKSFIFIIIPLVMLVVFIAIVCFFYSETHKQDKGLASIELSTSIERIYLGGCGEIDAVLRYSGDGSIEHGNFSYTSDRQDLVTFETKEGKYTGKYTIASKRNDETFNDVNVVITVSSLDNPEVEPNSIQLTVTDVQPLSISFFKNRTSTEQTTINIYQGYSISQINEIQNNTVAIPDYRPSQDYDIEWYSQETDELVAVNEDVVFYSESEIKLYGRYRLNKSLVLVDELDDSNSREIEAQLYFGESINDSILLRTLKEGLDNINGWSFKGWVPDINDDSSATAFSNGLLAGTFVSPVGTLYAKWTSTITFEVPLAKDATESLGVLKRADAQLGTQSYTQADTKTDAKTGTQSVSIPVTYNGRVGELPIVDYKYKDGLSAAEWLTGKFGEGASVNNYIKDGCYIGAPGQTYYNKTIVNIVFSDKLTNIEETKTVVYGACFNKDDFPVLEKDGWTIEHKWNVKDIGEVSEEEVSIATFCYNLNKATTCNAIWNVTIQYNADVGNIQNVYSEDERYYTVRYGDTLRLSRPSVQGAWFFVGWYDNVDLTGTAIKDQKTDSEEFIAFVNANKTLVDGKYVIKLYAKWENTVTLDYGYSNAEAIPEDYPTQLTLIYGKTISEATGKNLPTASDMAIPVGYSSGEAWYADKNQENKETIVDGNTKYYPLSVETLCFKWIGKKYKVTLKYIDKTNVEITVVTLEEVVFGKDMPVISEAYKSFALKPEGDFLGYYDTNTTIAYYDSGYNSIRKWDVAEDGVVLYALFGTEYKVSLDFNGGNGGATEVKTAYGHYLNAVNAPTKPGYSFTGYYDKKDEQSDTNKYYDANMNGCKVWNKTGNATLYAGWSVIHLNDITTSKANDDNFSGIDSSKSIYINISGGSGAYCYAYSIIQGYGVSASFDTATGSSYTNVKQNKLTVTKNRNNVNGKIKVTVTDYYTKESKSITLDFSTNCFAAGTRILMADGSYKNIENVKVGDIVMSWNFVTGQLEAMPVALYWYHGANVCDVLNLAFSDGTALRIIGTHGLFDYDLNQYVYLTAENHTEYIEHTFVIYDAVDGYNKIKLVNAYVTSEKVGSYSLRTACNDNTFAEGLLTLTAEDYPGYLTYFEVGENMKYDEKKMQADIELYGLFTYEDWLNDWSEYINYEEFIAFNGQYFKILLGKGILSYDDLFALIDGLRNGFDIQS